MKIVIFSESGLSSVVMTSCAADSKDTLRLLTEYYKLAKDETDYTIDQAAEKLKAVSSMKKQIKEDIEKALNYEEPYELKDAPKIQH